MALTVDSTTTRGTTRTSTQPATCSAPNCDRPASRRGLCSGHYQQQRRGQPAFTRIAPRKRARTKAEIAQFTALVRKIEQEALRGEWLGYAEQLVALVNAAEQAPADPRWWRGWTLADPDDGHLADGYALQVAALLDDLPALERTLRRLLTELEVVAHG